MGPRKRSRPNPKDEKIQNISQIQPAAPVIQSNSSISEAPSDQINVDMTGTTPDETRSRTWYGRGTWPRVQKSTASTQVARETILADKTSNITDTLSADLSRFDPKKLDNESATTIQATSADHSIKKETSNLVPQLSAIKLQAGRGDDGDGVNDELKRNDIEMFDADRDVAPTSALDTDATKGVEQRNTSSGWIGWLSLTKNQSSQERVQERLPRKSQEPSTTAEPATGIDKPIDNQIIAEEIAREIPLKKPEAVAISSSGFWSGFWPYSGEKPDNHGQKNQKQALEGNPTEFASDLLREAEMQKPEENVSAEPAPPAGSTWAFWSRQQPKVSEEATENSIGELAVAGDPSQDHPIPANASTAKGNNSESSKQERKGKSLSSEINQQNSTSSETSMRTLESRPGTTKTGSPNLLLPSFASTYRLMESPSIIQQIARLLLQSHQPPANHVFLAKDTPKIKRALAIGIHGLFPAPLLRTVIGQPTGTSIRFANHGATAIRRWADKNNLECDIEKIALEGEGKIGERVDHLWKLLLNWIDHVRHADFILIACHSQGVPVALMLISKLIDLGVVTGAKIGICAMAGVSLGPFPDYKSRFFSGSAAELFEFADLESEVSKRYQESLRIALKYGVRISYVGSIDDQLVSLESAIFSPVNHPYIYRAVFVDGRIHAPDFIANLVGFALKLRNLGVSDHQLIRELSGPLAGSLYSGEGHSRLYDEERIYDLAVQFALETTPLADNVPLIMQRYQASTSSNPFQLPWSMRGLLEEHVVKTELDKETTELLQQFDQWKPSTKVLKDVKYRLEAVKSKL